jgi:NAD(P)-dependent dehydrogenase (short-subunit alcohol dehydrogenase family)
MGEKLLDGKLAIVTGGTRGIGKAICRRLLKDGARVLTNGPTPDEQPPAGCEYRAVDFADDRQTLAFADELARLEPLVLVNNAGINRPMPFGDIDTAEFARIQKVNLEAPMALCRAVLFGMRKAKWGRIVNIGSIWGIVSKTGRAAYGASKAGLDGLTAGLAAEVAKDGILANVVAPGFVETEMLLASYDEHGLQALRDSVPMGRLAKPEEIAACVAWMAGPENSFISGQTIVIDGGFTRV